ncbi:unnamed protein product [Prorocentrum cordatum]|nr:unnamed protein product [Polarella glacialis]
MASPSSASGSAGDPEAPACGDAGLLALVPAQDPETGPVAVLDGALAMDVSVALHGGQLSPALRRGAACPCAGEAELLTSSRRRPGARRGGRGAGPAAAGRGLRGAGPRARGPEPARPRAPAGVGAAVCFCAGAAARARQGRGHRPGAHVDALPGGVRLTWASRPCPLEVPPAGSSRTARGLHAGRQVLARGGGPGAAGRGRGCRSRGHGREGVALRVLSCCLCCQRDRGVLYGRVPSARAGRWAGPGGDGTGGCWSEGYVHRPLREHATPPRELESKWPCRAGDFG